MHPASLRSSPGLDCTTPYPCDAWALSQPSIDLFANADQQQQQPEMQSPSGRTRSLALGDMNSPTAPLGWLTSKSKHAQCCSGSCHIECKHFAGSGDKAAGVPLAQQSSWHDVRWQPLPLRLRHSNGHALLRYEEILKEQLRSQQILPVRCIRFLFVQIGSQGIQDVRFLPNMQVFTSPPCRAMVGGMTQILTKDVLATTGISAPCLTNVAAKMQPQPPEASLE